LRKAWTKTRNIGRRRGQNEDVYTTYREGQPIGKGELLNEDKRRKSRRKMAAKKQQYTKNDNANQPLPITLIVSKCSKLLQDSRTAEMDFKI
jgi:hypothetical protein